MTAMRRTAWRSRPRAALTGNIRAPKIVIAEGALFKGNSDMSGRKDDRKDKAAASPERLLRAGPGGGRD